jgi:hypothetical protein
MTKEPEVKKEKFSFHLNTKELKEHFGHDLMLIERQLDELDLKMKIIDDRRIYIYSEWFFFKKTEQFLSILIEYDDDYMEGTWLESLENPDRDEGMFHIEYYISWTRVYMGACDDGHKYMFLPGIENLCKMRPYTGFDIFGAGNGCGIHNDLGGVRDAISRKELSKELSRFINNYIKGMAKELELLDFMGRYPD